VSFGTTTMVGACEFLTQEARLCVAMGCARCPSKPGNCNEAILAAYRKGRREPCSYGSGRPTHLVGLLYFVSQVTINGH